MNSFIHAKRLTILTLILVCGFTVGAGLHSTEAAEANTIRVQAGETLEIGTDTASPQSEFSWILTKDRKFQSAQRTRFFQTRLAEPGTYVLDVSVQDPITNENGYRAFTIVVTEPQGNLPTPRGNKTNPLLAVLQTNSVRIDNTTYVAPEGGILTIDSSGSDGNISSYQIDLDTSVDSNGDGNPENDIDNIGTLSEKFGSPLYVYMLPKNTQRKVRLTVKDLATIEPKTAELNVLFAPAPLVSSSSVASSNQNSPVRIERIGFTVHVSANAQNMGVQEKDLLYEWDFGDKSKSLLNAPSHTYSAPGQYVLSLRVLNISNAEVLYQGSDTVFIDALPIASSVSSQESSSSSQEPIGTTKDSSVSLKGILQVSFIIILLLGFAIGLYVLFTWIKRKTATGLQKTLEKMEGTITQKDSSVDSAKPAPMKLKKESPKQEEKIDPEEAVIDREKAKQEFKSPVNRSNETPMASAGPVPSWLAKASTPAVQPPKPQVSSVPAMPKPTTPPPSAPAPSAPPPPAQDTSVPAWLKPAPVKETVPTSSAPVPAKQTPPTVPSSPTASASQSTAADTKPKQAPVALPPPAAISTPKPEIVPPPQPAKELAPSVPTPAPVPVVKPALPATPTPASTPPPAAKAPVPTKTEETSVVKTPPAPLVSPQNPVPQKQVTDPQAKTPPLSEQKKIENDQVVSMKPVLPPQTHKKTTTQKTTHQPPPNHKKQQHKTMSPLRTKTAQDPRLCFRAYFYTERPGLSSLL